MPTSTPARNDFLDYLKGALIFLVVWGHVIQFASIKVDDRFYLDPVFKTIYMFHMPLFMAVSGFVSYHSISSSPFLFCVLKRARQILIPAVCWPVVTLMIGFLFCVCQQGSVSGGCREFLKMFYTLHSSLWFLWAVFGSTVVVAALKMLRQDRLEFFALATVIFLFAPDGADIYLFKYTFPYFCLGYALAKGDRIHVPKKIHPVWIVTIFAISAACFVFWKTDTYVVTTRMHIAPANLPNIALRYFAGVAVSAAFVLLLHGFYRLARSNHLSAWGKHSLGIYVIHCTALTLLESLGRFSENPWWFSALTAPVLAGLVCFITYLIGRSISRIPIARLLFLGESNSRPESLSPAPAI